MTGLLLTGPMGVDGSLNGMDDAMGLHEVDDLFGDTVLPPPPPSKALRQRVDGLRTRGCAHSVAWSKQGSIASVSRDGSSLELRFLRCHPETGVWELSPPTSCAALPPATGGVPIANLAWATTSSPELAVIDALGRIAILSFSITLNRPYLTRRWDQDTEDLHPVVGCYWLPLSPTPPSRPVRNPLGLPRSDPPRLLIMPCSTSSCTGLLSGTRPSTSLRMPSTLPQGHTIPTPGKVPCFVSLPMATFGCSTRKITIAWRKRLWSSRA